MLENVIWEKKPRGLLDGSRMKNGLMTICQITWTPCSLRRTSSHGSNAKQCVFSLDQYGKGAQSYCTASITAMATEVAAEKYLSKENWLFIQKHEIDQFYLEATTFAYISGKSRGK